MRVTRIDHVNVRIPADGVAEAVHFYHDVLGFTPEKLDAYRAGERTSFFFRLGADALLTVRPTDMFTPPDDTGYDHCCLVVDTEISKVKERLQEHSIPIERESTPYGAAGRAPAVYIRDPFGYRIEIKQAGTAD